MNPLDAVLKVTSFPRAKRLSAMLVATATSGILFFSPAVSVVAAGGSAQPSPRHSISYQDDTETKIVSKDGDENDDDTVVIEYNTGGDSSDNDDDVSPNEPDEKSKDDETGDESESRPIRLSGIMPSKADIPPSQWAGVFDSRLIAPFQVAPRPQLLRSDAIGLNAPITPREIVGGQMQTPKDEFEVTWYKETASPGEKGNMVFAGHLNWYGVPQAVFYNISQLTKGDEIVVTGENGEDYTYKVKWVKLIDTADADLDELVGQTKKASLTLITCGGEWDAAAGQYKQRTVVRAELVVQK